MALKPVFRGSCFRRRGIGLRALQSVLNIDLFNEAAPTGAAFELGAGKRCRRPLGKQISRFLSKEHGQCGEARGFGGSLSGRSSSLVEQVGVRARVQEHLSDGVAGLRGGSAALGEQIAQRSLAIIVSRVGVGSGSQQCFDHVRVQALAGQVDGLDAFVVSAARGKGGQLRMSFDDALEKFAGSLGGLVAKFHENGSTLGMVECGGDSLIEKVLGNSGVAIAGKPVQRHGAA